jgi:hypothetical protein
MVSLINRATKRLDLWTLQYPLRVCLVMLVVALVVIVVANAVLSSAPELAGRGGV